LSLTEEEFSFSHDSVIPRWLGKLFSFFFVLIYFQTVSSVASYFSVSSDTLYNHVRMVLHLTPEDRLFWSVGVILAPPSSTPPAVLLGVCYDP